MVATIALVGTVGILAAPAAADPGGAMAASPLEGSSLGVDIAVASPAGAGDGGIDCAGDPVGEHTCDKTGNLTAGPLVIDYEGFNDGTPAAGDYAFSDDVVVEIGGQTTGANVTCSFEGPALSGNPCPVEPVGV